MITKCPKCDSEDTVSFQVVVDKRSIGSNKTLLFGLVNKIHPGNYPLDDLYTFIIGLFFSGLFLYFGLLPGGSEFLLPLWAIIPLTIVATVYQFKRSSKARVEWRKKMARLSTGWLCNRCGNDWDL